jgi:formylmethanofuran dehydrogenase subunit E
VHGAFGAFIPIGIRVGLDAKERIKAEPRGLTVTYYTGEKAPCPCIADGVMLATNASPGQGTLVIAPEKAPVGMLAVVVVRNRKTGEGLTASDAERLKRGIRLASYGRRKAQLLSEVSPGGLHARR